MLKWAHVAEKSCLACWCVFVGRGPGLLSQVSDAGPLSSENPRGGGNRPQATP